MIDSALDPLEMILRQCAAAAPNPWYPSAYARANGISRDDLDPYLDRLRLGGWIRLTDWVQGFGQGYALTPEGQRVLQNPRDLARLLTGKLQARPKEEPVLDLADRRDTPLARGEAVRAVWLDAVTPVVTYAILAVNLLVFLVGLVLYAYRHHAVAAFLSPVPTNDPNVSSILHLTGALTGRDIVHGKWWRLLSCCFVHIGPLHLGLNMFFLYMIGSFQERVWGHGRYLLLYLIAGLGGSCAMVIIRPEATGAGASGALWGLMAADAAWIFLNRRYIGSQAATWLRQLTSMFFLNVLISLAPGISAAAHFGGGAVGLITAVLLNEERFARGGKRWLTRLGLAAIPTLCLVALLKPAAVGALVKNERMTHNWELLDLEERYLVPAGGLERAAFRLVAGKVEPLQRDKRKVPSVQEVSDAIAILREAREQLDQGAAILRKAGPYRNPEIEHERQSQVKRFEHIIQVFEATELQILAPILRDAERGAQQVYQDKIKPLHQEKVPDPEKRREAIAALSEARARFRAGLDLLQGTGPFSVPALQEERRRETELAQKQYEELQRLEIDTIRPQADASDRAARRVYQKVEPLLKLDPIARDAETVKVLIADLQEEQAKLDHLAVLLDQVGPCQDGRAEKVRQTRAQLLKAEAKVLGSAARRLQLGNQWTKVETDEFAEQLKQRDELRSRWKQLLQR
jgi:membrane associated rhomboid family serine protease